MLTTKEIIKDFKTTLASIKTLAEEYCYYNLWSDYYHDYDCKTIAQVKKSVKLDIGDRVSINKITKSYIYCMFGSCPYEHGIPIKYFTSPSFRANFKKEVRNEIKNFEMEDGLFFKQEEEELLKAEMDTVEEFAKKHKKEAKAILERLT
jgi:hypothetical protein